MNVNNRWVQLGASLVAMIMIANLQYAWTMFVEPIRTATGWKLSDVQLAFTLFILFQTWVQPLDGWLIDRLGPRALITIAGVLCGAGWAAMGSVHTLPQLYTAYIVAGVGAAFVYSGCVGSVLKWFTDQRGLAAGIIAAGFGGGTALFIPVIARLLRAQGYSGAFFWTGIVQGTVIVLVAQALRSAPAAPKKAGPVAEHKNARRTAEQFSTWEMLRTPHFYMLYLMFVMVATGGLMITAQAGPIARSWGISAAFLTMALTFNPIANGTSRIFWGWVSDHLGRERTMSVAFFLQAICLLLVVTVGRTSGTLFAVTLVLVFFTWGEIYSLFPSTSGDYFGTAHSTSNYACLYTAKGVATTMAGFLAAALFERLGSWSFAFYGSAAMAFIGCMMSLALRSFPLPAHRPAGLSQPLAAR
jgi:OFA family oxalate/formate antiporter-like MFS transporter